MTMNIPNNRNRSVERHNFATTPRPDVPRSTFDLSHGVKCPFNFSDLIPVMIEEVLPGDLWKIRATVVCRTAVPIVPLQDNWRFEIHFWYIPMRILWTNARKFWGKQDNPGDSIAFTIPKVTPPAGGFLAHSLFDYMGIPVVGQNNTNNTLVNALPFRAYNRVWNDWYRDQNLIAIAPNNTGDGPDVSTDYPIRHTTARPTGWKRVRPSRSPSSTN